MRPECPAEEQEECRRLAAALKVEEQEPAPLQGLRSILPPDEAGA